MVQYIKVSPQRLKEINLYSLSGLNEFSPDEIAKPASTPYARNFRIFDTTMSSDIRTAISKRSGMKSYSVPVGSTADASVVSVTGAANQAITTISWYAMPFTAASTGTLDKIQLNVLNNNAGTAPLIVKIYSSVNSAPGALLATSSISGSAFSGSAQYIDVSFIEAPVIVSGTTYWFSVGQQSEGTGDYKITSTTVSTLALSSNSAGNAWSVTTLSLNFKTYICTAGGILGATRYYSTGAPKTIFAKGTSLYSVNDVNGAVTQIATGFNAAATNYNFCTVNNKLYYTNNVDVPQVWNGTTNAVVGGSPGVSSDILVYKNRLFLLQGSNRVIFSEPADYENFLAVNYVYVPAAYTADPVVTFKGYQGYLYFFTRNTKYVLRGSDLSTLNLTETNAKKGCTGPKAICTDKSYIYFLGPDGGFYKFNGSTDVEFGTPVKMTLGNIAAPQNVTMTVYDMKIHLYYAPSGIAYNKNVLIWDLDFQQWCRDENVYLSGSIECNSQTDTEIIYGFSSMNGRMVQIDKGTSDLGKPIEFDYWTNYMSFGHPTMKHRIKRLYPAFRSGLSAYNVDVQIDVDYYNLPTHNYVNLGVVGSTWGAFVWGDGTLWGGSTLVPRRISVGGANRRHQIRFVQYGVDNPVRILGYSMYYQLMKPI